MILLRRMEANLEEQVAGLLHDVSHTAFSHVIDWVLGDPTKEDYQDNKHLELIKNSDIPMILSKYNFDYTEISKVENFSLLEKEAPSLCADRIDYTLRELKDERFGDINFIISNLMNKEENIIFRTKEAAEIFANEYMRLQKEHWAGNQARARYYLLSLILREGIENKIITLKDLRETDDYVINLLKNSNNKYISDGLKRLKEGFEIIEDKSGIELKKKFRYIDPEISFGDSVKKLSDISEDYKNYIIKEKNKSNNYIKIKI